MRKHIKIFILAFLITASPFLLLCIVFFGARMIENIQTKKHTKALDQARSEYVQSLDTMQTVEALDNEYVKTATVTLRKEGYVEADTREHRDDRHVVEVQMDESFNDLPLKQRCTICLDIMDEIESYLDYAYRHSSYYKLYKSYLDERIGLMDYGKGKLSIGRSFEFTFDDGTSTYEFPHQSFGYDMVMDGVKYSLVISSGQVQAVVKAESGGGSGSSGGSGAPNSGSSGSGKENSGTKPSGSSAYDPYDANDYDSAEDFADDKYEEFYDYEDEYEDEDEAYDAAEEYWEDY